MGKIQKWVFMGSCTPDERADLSTEGPSRRKQQQIVSCSCRGFFAETGALLCWSWELCWPPLISLKMACLRLKMQSAYFHKQTSEKRALQYCTHHLPCGEKGVKLSKMSLTGWKITGCFCLELCSLTETFRLLFLTALLLIRDMFSNPGRPSAESRTAVCV